MVLFILVRDPLQDIDCFLPGGLLHGDRLETALQRGIPLHVFMILADRRRADHLQLAAGKRGFQDIGGIDGPLRAAGADQGMHLIDEEDDIAVLRHLADHLLDPLLKLAAVLGARDHPGKIKRQHALVLHGERYIPGHDPLREAFHHRGLADTGFADEAGIVLGAAAQRLNDPADLLLPPDDGIEFPLRGQCREIPGKLFQSGGALLAGLSAAEILADQIGILAHGGQRLGIHLLQVDPHGGKESDSHILPLPDQREQDMLGTGLLGMETLRDPARFLQYALRARGEPVAVHGLQRRFRDDELGEHLRELILRNAVALQHPGGRAGILAQQSQQDVLRPHIGELQVPRDLLRLLERMARFIRIVLFHLPPFLSP